MTRTVSIKGNIDINNKPKKPQKPANDDPFCTVQRVFECLQPHEKAGFCPNGDLSKFPSSYDQATPAQKKYCSRKACYYRDNHKHEASKFPLHTLSKIIDDDVLYQKLEEQISDYFSYEDIDNFKEVLGRKFRPRNTTISLAQYNGLDTTSLKPTIRDLENIPQRVLENLWFITIGLPNECRMTTGCTTCRGLMLKEFGGKNYGPNNKRELIKLLVECWES